jgi:hypothetical protein
MASPPASTSAVGGESGGLVVSEEGIEASIPNGGSEGVGVDMADLVGRESRWRIRLLPDLSQMKVL